MKNDAVSCVNPMTGKERRIHTRIGESVALSHIPKYCWKVKLDFCFISLATSRG